MAVSQDAATTPEKAARWIFGGASVYGFLTLVPMWFFEPVIAARNPPALTHPEFFYGFLGLALAFQVLFALIAWQPRRLAAAIPAAVAEKYLYAAAIAVLIVSHRLDDTATAVFAAVDAALGSAFLLSFRALRKGPVGPATDATDGRSTVDNASRPRFLVLTMRTDRFDPNVLEPHYAFLASLRSKGLLLDAGGFGDRSGGAYVITANSLEAAESIADEDPLHVWGASKLTVREWKSTRVDVCSTRA